MSHLAPVSSPFVSVVPSASPGTPAPAGAPTDPAAVKAFYDLLDKAKGVHPPTVPPAPAPAPEPVAASADDEGDESEVPTPAPAPAPKKRKPSAKVSTPETDAAIPPSTMNPPQPVAPPYTQDMTMDANTIALSYPPDTAWVMLKSRAAESDERAARLTENIEKMIAELKTLGEQREPVAAAMQVLENTLIALTGGKPGQFGAVRITVIDGEPRLDIA